jgi:hypothetical protein
LVSEHEDARRRRLGGDSLQPARPAHPVAREPTHLLRDLGRHRCHRVVVGRLDTHDPRRLGGAKPNREQRPERDRNLAEDVAGMSLADDAVDAVDDLYCLDPTLEEREQRALLALVGGVFAGPESDVGCRPRQPLARGPTEVAENGNATNVVCGHHRLGEIDRTSPRLLGSALPV